MSEQPIEAQFQDQMRALAHALDDILNGEERPKKVGFMLLVFNFGEEGKRSNYISNAVRKDMLLVMKEFIARAEGRILDGEEIQ